MKKIEAIIRKSKFEDVKQALYNAGIEWFSYWDITGLGKSTEDQVVRGQVFQSNYIQRRMLSIVVRNINLEKTVNAIMCHSNLDLRRPEIKKQLKKDINIPVLFITQALGLSMGISAKELGLDKHFVPTGKAVSCIVKKEA